MVERMKKTKCHNCGGTLRELPLFRKLARVTSDCRPWPFGGRIGVCSACDLVQSILSPSWGGECRKIYSTYHIYRQSGGAEQAVFSGGQGTPRSKKIVDWLKQQARLPMRGEVLDVGCGNGGFLRALRGEFPRWGLSGTEFDRRNEKALRKIRGFHKLYDSRSTPPAASFDLISLVHVLEHMAAPSEYLKGLHPLARPGARVLIQVPDAERNPFILPVADHASHFSQSSLRRVAERAGIRVKSVRHDVVARELTLLGEWGVKQKAGGRRSGKHGGREWAEKNLGLLKRMSDEAQREAKNGKLVVFGSSLGAAWIHGITRGRVETFLDEDRARHGRKHLGVPIVRPGMGQGRGVLLPLAGKTRRWVEKMLKSKGWRIIKGKNR
jgi:SAM-dependent methyltransferase